MSGPRPPSDDAQKPILDPEPQPPGSDRGYSDSSAVGPAPSHTGAPRPVPIASASWPSQEARGKASAKAPAVRDEGILEARLYLEAGRRTIDAAFDAGAPPQDVVRTRAELYDGLVRRLFDAASAEYTSNYGTADSRLTLCAVGGYGRGELSPASDLDLLFLYPYESGVYVETVSERVLYRLWDLSLEVGSSVRSIGACIRLARSDLSAYTALLDHRYLCGDRDLYDEFETLLFRAVVQQGVHAFFEMRKQEDARRRERYTDTIYLLEPNLKQGEGGLRDLHQAMWAARVRFRVKGVDELLRVGAISERDAAALNDAHAFLLRVREHLHRIARRKLDRLTFDVQEQVAHALGYEDTPGALAVEQFMQRYYQAARNIRRLAARILERCAMGTRRRVPPRSHPAGSHFRIFEGALSVQREGLFDARPVAMLELHAEAMARELPLLPYAKDLITEHAPRVDDALRADAHAAEVFLEILTNPADPCGTLREMHDLGLLGAYLPEFGRLTGKHQHTLYHVYTVDVHTLAALERLKALHRGDLAEEEPHLTAAMRLIERPRTLYLGLLFHDIGKGTGRDHSTAGAEIAAGACRRMGLTPDEIEEVQFLVQNHLYLVKIATRRDLHDDSMVADVCRHIEDVERLCKLYVLTYCDSVTTGPNVWNEWKSTLSRELFDRAYAYLRGEDTRDATLAEEAAIRRGAARQALGAGDESLGAYLDTLPDRYFLAFPPDAIARHRSVAAELESSGRAFAFERFHVPGGGYTEVILSCADRPGLLALLTGAMAAERIDILAARIFTRTTGQALDVFYVRPSDAHSEPDAPVWRRLEANLAALLGGTTTVEALMTKTEGSRLLQKPVPSVLTRVELDNTTSKSFSIVDVLTQDRTGVLYLITRTLFELGLTIELSKIATEANRVIDAFYVREVGGGKVERPERLEEIKRRLHEVLGAGAPPRPVLRPPSPRPDSAPPGGKST